MSDPFVGQLAFMRVYSGALRSGDTVYNPRLDRRERIGRLLKMHANKREEISEVFAGDIAAAVGLKSVSTGDTVCTESDPVAFEAMEFPAPVISVAIEPKTKADQEKLAGCLEKLTQEDPTFHVHTDPDTGETLISGMGELHLEILVDRMMREFKVAANVGRPQVAYRETISKRARRKANTSGKPEAEGSTAMFSFRSSLCPILILPPLPTSPRRNRPTNMIPISSCCLSTRSWADRFPREYIPAVYGGIREAMEGGVLAGYEMTGVRVALTEGSYHEVDSSEMAFKIAGSMGFKEAVRRAEPILLEPVMKVEVVVPEEYMGDVLGDLSARRGHIESMEKRGSTQIIRTMVPLAEMFGYATDLRSRTQGRASYSMHFSRYEPAPASISEEVVARVQGRAVEK